MERANWTWEQKRVREWVTRHRGVFVQVAVQCGVSPQFVRQVAYGITSTLPGHDVERALRKRGCPKIHNT